MKRDDFEMWFGGSKYTQVVYPSAATKQIALDGWQTCAEQYEAERNSMLAVIAEKDKALELFVNPCSGGYGSESGTYIGWGNNSELTAGERVQHARKALALTPENVRLVEVAHLKFKAAQVWSGNPEHGPETDEWLEVCLADDIGDDGVKAYPVYTIETIEAKGE